MLMTDKIDTTYVAQITLSLPGNDDVTSVVVTLAPTDSLPLGEKTKPLSDCTLAELSAYGEALEAEVWQAYEAISLLDLRRRAAVDIHVTALDGSGQAVDEVEDWLDQAIVFTPVAGAAEAASVAANGNADTTGASEAADEAPPEPDAETATATVDEPSSPVPEPEAPPEIVLIKPAPKPAEKEKPAPETKPAPPKIIPSQARVRVAGGRLPLAESGGAAADILLDEAPLRAMQAHALSSLDREVAGVMVGRQPEKQPDGRYVVHIIDSIVAKYTVMQGASVTYTPESWRYMTDTLWERYPDDSAVIVGWYHTHPGFGIFLSGMDLFIHQNFFTQTWHVAYVLDPRARTSGFFCWNRPKTKVSRYDFLWPDWAQGSW